jgi:cytochrome c556
MRRIVLAALGIIAVLSVSALAEDGKAAFEHRRDTMKAMGRALYIGVGRVIKGRADYGPDTLTTAEDLAKLAATIGTLFPTGSAVPDSNMQPAILDAPAKVEQLAAGVRAAVAAFVPEVKSGDKARIAVAYAAVNKACEACHTEFRKEE